MGDTKKQVFLVLALLSAPAAASLLIYLAFVPSLGFVSSIGVIPVAFIATSVITLLVGIPLLLLLAYVLPVSLWLCTSAGAVGGVLAAAMFETGGGAHPFGGVALIGIGAVAGLVSGSVLKAGNVGR